MRNLLYVFALLFAPLSAYAINENEALTLSLADLKTIPEQDQCYNGTVKDSRLDNHRQDRI